MNLTFDIDGQPVLSALQDMGKELDSWKEAGPDAEKVFHEEEREVFNSRGFGSWPELAPSTLAFKEQHYPFMDILERTRRLEFSLTKKTGDTVSEIGDKEFIFGSRVPYGKYHMGQYKRRPARPPIMLRQEALEKYLKVFKNAGIRKARRVNRAWVQTDIEEF